MSLGSRAVGLRSRSVGHSIGRQEPTAQQPVTSTPSCCLRATHGVLLPACYSQLVCFSLLCRLLLLAPRCTRCVLQAATAPWVACLSVALLTSIAALGVPLEGETAKRRNHRETKPSRDESAERQNRHQLTNHSVWLQPSRRSAAALVALCSSTSDPRSWHFNCAETARRSMRSPL